MTSTEVWSSNAAVSGYIFLKNGMQFGPFEVKACSSQDLTNYDNEVYRDTFPGAYGDQGAIISPSTTDRGVNGTTTGTTTVTIIDPSDATPATIAYSNSATTAGPSSMAVFIDDVVGHKAPRFVQKTGTIYYFWSGAKDVSDVVFSCPKEYLPVFSKAEGSYAS